MKRIAVMLLMTVVTCCFISVPESPAVPLPSEVSLEKNGISLKVSWTPVTGADGYRLYYAPYPYTGSESIGSMDAGEETEVSYTLWEGASYYVAVTAYDETGESRYSNSELFLLGPYTTDHTAGTPKLTIETDALEVSTSWTTISDATGYRLYYAPYPLTALNTISNVDMGPVTDADFTLWDAAAFYIAVTAEEDGNESGYSNVELLLTGNPIPEWQNEGYVDADDDGYSLDEGDCHDGNAAVNPGASDICGDAIDQDCSGSDAICQTTSSTLPDTGQTACYDTAGPEISCAGTGQDGEFTINPMSYTANGNGTVTDNVTGLIWQQSDDDQTRTWQAAIDYCSSYSPDGSSWRLPSVSELQTIVDAGTYSPAINAVFTGTNASNYWSSTSNANNPDNAWYVSFYDGNVYGNNKPHNSYARCVR